MHSSWVHGRVRQERGMFWKYLSSFTHTLTHLFFHFFFMCKYTKQALRVCYRYGNEYKIVFIFNMYTPHIRNNVSQQYKEVNTMRKVQSEKAEEFYLTELREKEMLSEPSPEGSWDQQAEKVRWDRIPNSGERWARQTMICEVNDHITQHGHSVEHVGCWERCGHQSGQSSYPKRISRPF